VLLSFCFSPAASRSPQLSLARDCHVFPVAKLRFAIAHLCREQRQPLSKTTLPFPYGTGGRLQLGVLANFCSPLPKTFS